jgi:hypothetical protein
LLKLMNLLFLPFAVRLPVCLSKDSNTASFRVELVKFYPLYPLTVTKGRTWKLPKRLSKPTDMTIHWKVFEEHFLMVPLVF